MTRVAFTATVIGMTMSMSAAAQQLTCPQPDANGHVKFPDGSILMETALAVNPDGAAASYTPGDHGYTYISNGVNIIENGKIKSCSNADNKSRCRTGWLQAEAGGFADGTPEFCVFAMEVEPLTNGGQKVVCDKPEKGRSTVGNGKGRPKAGATVTNVLGQPAATYSSTTTLRHVRNGQTIYVDSAAIPGLVVPTSRKELVGAIAWVRFGTKEGFAIVNDTGPRFGEGSVALHQLLHTGSIGPQQPIGPIPLANRCTEVETKLAKPFVSRPDNGKDDRCKPHHKPQSPADIRAYSGIDEEEVVSIILSAVKPPMKGTKVTQELTVPLLAQVASAAGYTAEKLHQMARCVE